VVAIHRKPESDLFNFSAIRSNRNIDQMASYLAEAAPRGPEAEHSPIAYWMSKRTTWPELSSMALDMFVVPAMSDEPERLFSSAGHTMSPRRRLMLDDTLESLIIMKSWLQQDVVRITEEEIQQLKRTSRRASTPRSPSVL
jgi:hypothetical protein